MWSYMFRWGCVFIHFWTGWLNGQPLICLWLMWNLFYNSKWARKIEFVTMEMQNGQAILKCTMCTVDMQNSMTVFYVLQAQQPLNRLPVVRKCCMQFSPALIMCHIHFWNVKWAVKVKVKITGDSETKHGTAEPVVKHRVLGLNGRITF